MVSRALSSSFQIFYMHTPKRTRYIAATNTQPSVFFYFSKNAAGVHHLLICIEFVLFYLMNCPLIDAFIAVFP